MALIKLNNQSISAVSALPSGVGNGIVQVVQHEQSSEHSTNTSLAVSQYTKSITPTSASNKILIVWDAPFRRNNSNTATYCDLRLYKNGSELKKIDGAYTSTLGERIFMRANFVYLDSPATISSTTYAIYWGLGGTFESGGFIMNDSSSIGTLTLMEIKG